MTSSIVTFILTLFAGYVMGSLVSYFLRAYKKPDGYFFVNLVNPEDEMFKMQIDIPLEQLPNEKYLIFRVKKIQ